MATKTMENSYFYAVHTCYVILLCSAVKLIFWVSTSSDGFWSYKDQIIA